MDRHSLWFLLRIIRRGAIHGQALAHSLITLLLSWTGNSHGQALAPFRHAAFRIVTA